MLLVLIDERFVFSLDGFGFRLSEGLNRWFHCFGLSFRFGHLSLGIEQEVQVAHLLLTFFKELVHLWLMLRAAGIWSGLQRQESFLGGEQTLGQLGREINQPMELLTETLLNVSVSSSMG